MGKDVPVMPPLNEKVARGKKRGRKRKLVFVKGTEVSSETFGVGTVLREGMNGILICDFGGSVREVPKDTLAIREGDSADDVADVEENLTPIDMGYDGSDDDGAIGDTDNGVSDE